MQNSGTLLRLMTLLSPSFPVGGFAYSGGLEQAVADGHVSDAHTLQEWLECLARQGMVWNDAVLLAASHRCATSGDELQELIELAEAISGSKERHLEQQNLGNAFIEAVKAGGLALPRTLGDHAAYSIAVGAVAGAQGLDIQSALTAYLHGFISNQIQCGIRLGVLGQNGGVALLTALEPVILQVAELTASSSLDDLGSNTLIADISAMRHETLYSRIFRT